MIYVDLEYDFDTVYREKCLEVPVTGRHVYTVELDEEDINYIKTGQEPALTDKYYSEALRASAYDELYRFMQLTASLQQSGNVIL